MAEVALESQIEEVTVYPDRARVTRRSSSNLEAGLRHLVFDRLPLTMQKESLRVTGKGTAKVRVLGVTINEKHYEVTPADAVKEVEAEIEEATEALRAIQDQQASLNAHTQYLNGMRDATASYAEGLAQGKTTVADQAELIEFLQKQDLDGRAKARRLERESRELQMKQDQLKRKMRTLRSQRPRQRYQVVLELDVLEGGTFNPQLTYVVKGAKWKPLYDFRLLPANDTWQFELTTLIEVSQETGEDWGDIVMSLSTAQPAMNQRLPSLQPWYIDAADNFGAPAVARVGAEMDDVDDFLDSLEEEEAEKEAEAEMAEATVNDESFAVSFTAEGRFDVPSDGSTVKTTLHRVQIKPRLDYLAVPKHTEAVYRRVTVANETPSPLLPGEVTLFAGDEYIGQTKLEYTPRGGEMQLLLGIEDRLVVTRELTQRDVDKKFLRDRRQLRYGYEIVLKNMMGEAAQVTVQDHMPVSRDERIKVEMGKAKPAVSEQSQLNMINWVVQLDAGGETTLVYDYLIEHPRAVAVNGLVD
ncbi:MAG TPA: mucoidy inhibitor MuiA family protein [Anaerolineae bacterium]|nr:mucoidy inhibitor MuiA family protein [Anaerolineae bacterium]